MGQFVSVDYLVGYGLTPSNSRGCSEALRHISCALNVVLTIRPDMVAFAGISALRGVSATRFEIAEALDGPGAPCLTTRPTSTVSLVINKPGLVFLEGKIS